MKHALLAAAVVAVSLTSLASPGAMAQDWDHNRDARSYAWRDHGGPDRRPPVEFRRERYWRPGDRLPPAYYAKPYIIVKPVAYHLHRAPRGHHWVRVGTGAALVVVGTGVVVEWVPGLFP